MSARNNFVFQGLHIAAWVIFIGLCIEAGALIYNFIFRLFNPEFVQNLYDRSKWVFVSIYSFILVISILKAYLFLVVIRLLNRLNLSQPFNSYVAGQIKKISYSTLSIGLISYLGQQFAKNLMNRGFEIDSLGHHWADTQAYILMAAVIYVIAAIFSRGVEIQNENDLTV